MAGGGRKRRKLLDAAIESLGPDNAFDLYSKLLQPSDTGDLDADLALESLGEVFDEQIQEEESEPEN